MFYRSSNLKLSFIYLKLHTIFVVYIQSKIKL